MRNLMWRTYGWGQRQVRVLLGNERGDQNISGLGLIVVTLLIIGVMVKLFGAAMPDIINGVIGKIKGTLGLS